MVFEKAAISRTVHLRECPLPLYFYYSSEFMCLSPISLCNSLVSILFCHIPFATYREEKLLRHIAMVAKFLDDNKPIKSLKSLFALFQTSPTLFNFI